MDILVIEDNETKALELTQCLESSIPGINIVVKESYSDGLREVLANSSDYDIFVVDMTLPIRQSVGQLQQEKLEHFGGEELLLEVKRYKKERPFIIFTAFSHFGEESSDSITLSRLLDRVKKNHPKFYKGCVRYKSGSDDWKQQILRFLKLKTKDNK